MKTWIFTITSLCFLTCPFWATQAKSQSLANNLMNTVYCNSYFGSWYFTAGAGGSFPNVSDDNFVNTGPGWPVDHYFQGNAESTGLGTIGTGFTLLRYAQDTLPYVSLGLSYSYALGAKTNGYIEQYSLPQFKNYNYNYQIERQTLLAVVKADLFHLMWWCRRFMPYLSAGVGASWNKASNYQEEKLSHVTPRVSPGYHENTSVYFSYSVGAGIDYMVQNNFWVSLDYSYGNYGYARTGKGANTPTLTGSNYSNERLKNKLTANNVTVSITGLLNFV